MGDVVAHVALMGTSGIGARPEPESIPLMRLFASEFKSGRLPLVNLNRRSQHDSEPETRQR